MSLEIKYYEQIIENQNNSDVGLNNEKEYESNYIFEIKTVQSSPFRSLIEALKEILTDANIEFDENGMKIVAVGCITHCFSTFKT